MAAPYFLSRAPLSINPTGEVNKDGDEKLQKDQIHSIFLKLSQRKKDPTDAIPSPDKARRTLPTPHRQDLICILASFIPA